MTNATSTPTKTPRYEIKCDDCKATIGRTNLVSESAAGGRCAECRNAPVAYPESWK